VHATIQTRLTTRVSHGIHVGVEQHQLVSWNNAWLYLTAAWLEGTKLHSEGGRIQANVGQVSIDVLLEALKETS
jgi:hypothetical protein